MGVYNIRNGEFCDNLLEKQRRGSVFYVPLNDEKGDSVSQMNPSPLPSLSPLNPPPPKNAPTAGELPRPQQTTKLQQHPGSVVTKPSEGKDCYNFDSDYLKDSFLIDTEIERMPSLRLTMSISGGSGSSAGGGMRVPQSPVMTSYSKRVTLKKLRTWRVPGECKCCPDLRVDPKIGFALVDNMPSPYDQEGLRFKRGDRIQILCMNPSGLWRGRLLAPQEAKAVIEARMQDRRRSLQPLAVTVSQPTSTGLDSVKDTSTKSRRTQESGVVRTEGVFKFIHVRIMEDIENMYDSIQLNQKISVEQVLLASNLSFLHPILTLNGFDNMAELVKISKDDFAFLGIAASHQDTLYNSLRSIINNFNPDGDTFVDDVVDASVIDDSCCVGEALATINSTSSDSCLSESMSDLSLSSGHSSPSTSKSDTSTSSPDNSSPPTPCLSINQPISEEERKCRKTWLYSKHIVSDNNNVVFNKERNIIVDNDKNVVVDKGINVIFDKDNSRKSSKVSDTKSSKELEDRLRSKSFLHSYTKFDEGLMSKL